MPVAGAVCLYLHVSPLIMTFIPGQRPSVIEYYCYLNWGVVFVTFYETNSKFEFSKLSWIWFTKNVLWESCLSQYVRNRNAFEISNFWFSKPVLKLSFRNIENIFVALTFNKHIFLCESYYTATIHHIAQHMQLLNIDWNSLSSW